MHVFWWPALQVGAATCSSPELFFQCCWALDIGMAGNTWRFPENGMFQ